MGGEVDAKYAQPDGRKTVEASWNPVKLLMNPNKFTIAVAVAVVLLILMIVLIVRAIVRRVRRGKGGNARGYQGYRGKR